MSSLFAIKNIIGISSAVVSLLCQGFCDSRSSIRKISICFAISLTFISGSAFAGGWKVTASSTNGISVGQYYSSTSQACNAALALKYTNSGHYVQWIGGTSTNGYCRADGSIILIHLTFDSSYEPPVVPTQCAGSPTPEIRATNSWAAMQNPVCTWDTPEHLNATCSGTLPNGRPVTTGFWCNGPIGNQTDGPIPDDIPNPPPPVKVSFPDCPVGTYAYTDLDNVTTCSVNTYNASPQPCASGNAGSVNGQLVCLPANPAPATAANERVNAQNKANEAKSAPATPAAIQAAIEAAIAAQKAKDAADSLPTSSDAASDAQKAIAAAKQAAAYAGQPYNGPQPTSTGTGGGGTSPEDTGPKECGSPGKPKCQIDETGTPTDGTTAFTAANTALDDAVATYTDSLATITSDTDKDASWGWLPSLPQGSCTPIQFAALGEVNWCDSAASIEEVMTFMWSFITVFCLLGMVARAIKGT